MSDLRTQLRSIYDKHGQLTPGLIVKEARPKTHPLHDRFEWDDKKAGEAWRREQASDLIRSIQVSYTNPAGITQTVREWHSIRVEDAGPFVYDPIDEIIGNPVSAAVLLRDMERDWNNLKQRYEHFAEFWKLVQRDTAA